MKMTRTKSLAGLALTCIALAGASSSVFADVVISTFDSDLAAFVSTNFWRTGDPGFNGGYPTIVWTNTGGNPDGAMVVSNDWSTTNAWQDRKCQADVLPIPGYDFREYGFVEFDAKVISAPSQTNSAGGWGSLSVIAQGFDGWGDNTNQGGYTTLSTVTLSDQWVHYKVSTVNFPHFLSRLTFSFVQNPANTNTPTTTATMIDNVTLTAPPPPPPRIQYVNAIRGLNMWSGGSQYERDCFESFQDGSLFYMWANGNTPASYSFTIASYPNDLTKTTNLVVRLMLIPANATEASPDWNEANALVMDLTMQTNGFPMWIFRWKTNTPDSNGQLYDADRQVTLTNNTPLGKWTLSFSSDQNVTMTAPNGNSTNFVMGVHPNVPDISPAFYDVSTNRGTVYFGLYTSDTNAGDLLVVFSSWVIAGNLNGISNNWAAQVVPIDPNQWVRVANAPYYLVTNNGAKWLQWGLPDTGFKLQTNTVGVGVSNCWSTNHGLPPADIYSLHKGILVYSNALPPSPKLFFRLSSPGF